MAAIRRLKPYTGPALLSYGFRPFFLAASIWAALNRPGTKKCAGTVRFTIK